MSNEDNSSKPNTINEGFPYFGISILWVVIAMLIINYLGPSIQNIIVVQTIGVTILGIVLGVVYKNQAHKYAFIVLIITSFWWTTKIDFSIGKTLLYSIWLMLITVLLFKQGIVIGQGDFWKKKQN